MNTPVSPDKLFLSEDSLDPLKEEAASGPPVPPPVSGEQEEVYSSYFDEEDEPDEGATVTPFAVSQEMPEIRGISPKMGVSAPPVAPTIKRRKPHFSLTLIAIIVCVVVIVGFLFASAQAMPGSPMPMRDYQQAMPAQALPPRPTNPQQSNGQTMGNPTNEVPQQLPAGWAAAGLLTSDAVEAERTAMAFTDREMSLDYRSAGSRNRHSGTFTAATVLLTPAAMQRYLTSDVRVINNTLWDKVQQEKLIQTVVDAQPQLVQFAKPGQQQLAWVDISFHLFESRQDGKGTERFDVDPATNQPMLHHMGVVLLRVPPQGQNPAMGGTGWMVSVYALDLPGGQLLNAATPA